jgi:uncharacterized damage-inducible protein DinB
VADNLLDQFEMIVAASKEVDQQFLDNLTDEDRQAVGTYQKWSAKDLFAHVNFWQRLEAEKILEWLETGTAEPAPHFEQSNLDAYNTFAESSWDEIIASHDETVEMMREVMGSMSEEILLGPSWGSEERKMWESLVQRIYSHKLIHYSEYYQEKEQIDITSRLWSEWAELVSPLDPGDRWQGRVYYNAACGLALAGDRDGALAKLSISLEMQPGMKTWARLDGDLAILHGSEEFKPLITTEYWWEALRANPQAEAVADQFIRTFAMLREAVSRFSEAAWMEGESNYQRPAGLALHIAQTVGIYSSLKPGDAFDDPLMQVNWENPDRSVLPPAAEFLELLDGVETRMARFLKEADLEAEEDQFPWTGSTKLSRALYTLRHTQHHLADMAMELQRRGLQPPDWA